MKHLIKQTSLLTISNVLTKIVSMLFFIILARFFSVADYGSFRYLLTVASLFSISFTGFTTALTRFISKYEKNKNEYSSNTIFIISIIFIISSLIILLTIKNPLLVILFLFSLLIDAFYLGLIRGLLRTIKLAFFKLNENIIQLLFLILLYFLTKNVNFTLAVIFYALAGTISLIILEFIKSSRIKFSFNLISKEKIKQLTKFAIPVTIGAIGFDIMFNIDTVFIKYFLNNTQVGLYSVPRTLIQVFNFIPVAITTLLMPKVARATREIKHKINFAILGNFLISLLIFIIILIFGKLIITLLFTSKYLSSINVFYILSFGQLFFTAHLIHASYWQGKGKPHIPSIIISIACILNVIGNYLLVPIYGIIGAAISTAFTSFIAFLISLIIFKKNETRL